jgi:hypothetical protein
LKFAPAALPLAPAATELEFRGPLLQSGWSVSLKEEIVANFPLFRRPTVPNAHFPLCIGTGPEEKTLLLGAVPRAEVTPQARPKEREKQRSPVTGVARSQASGKASPPNPG